jgi:hypothetical protein
MEQASRWPERPAAPAPPATWEWRAIGASVRGASHVRAGLPNQDAIYLSSLTTSAAPDALAAASTPGPPNPAGPAAAAGSPGTPLLLAVADGHGSAKCLRSDTGARLAVETAARVIREALHDWSAPTEQDRWAGACPPPSPSAGAHAPARQPLQPQAESDAGRAPALPPQPAPVPPMGLVRTTDRAFAAAVAEQLVRRWREAVEAHLQEDPLSPGELATLEQKDGAAARRLVEATPLLAYGTTLLIVLVTDAAILYLQLGDGDVLTVSAAGEVARPVPADARLFANETTSLCSRQAWRDFRIGVQPLRADGDGPANGPSAPAAHADSAAPALPAAPALILVSTDGYANSFRDEAGFQRVGSDLLELVRAEGIDAVDASLEGWLSEASRLGSGDDVTLGVICRLDAVERRQDLTPSPSPPRGEGSDGHQPTGGVPPLQRGYGAREAGGGGEGPLPAACCQLPTGAGLGGEAGADSSTKPGGIEVAA